MITRLAVTEMMQTIKDRLEKLIVVTWDNFRRELHSHAGAIQYFPVPRKYSGFQYESIHHRFIGMSEESA